MRRLIVFPLGLLCGCALVHELKTGHPPDADSYSIPSLEPNPTDISAKDCSSRSDDKLNPFVMFQISPYKIPCASYSKQSAKPQMEDPLIARMSGRKTGLVPPTYFTSAAPRIIVDRGDQNVLFQIYIESQSQKWAFFDNASFQWDGQATPFRPLGKIDRKVELYRPLEEIYYLNLTENEFNFFTTSDMTLRLYGRNENEDFVIPSERFKGIWDDYQGWTKLQQRSPASKQKTKAKQ